MSQTDVVLLDELPNKVFESFCSMNDQRTRTIPESPNSNTSFDDDNQPTDLLDQSIIIPVSERVTHSQDSHVNATTPETQSADDVMLSCETPDLDPTVHRELLAGQRSATTETVSTVPQQADSSHRPRRATASQSPQSWPQRPVPRETAMVSLQDARLDKRSRMRPDQAGLRRPASPDSAESDDSDDHDFYGSNDEEDRGSNNELQARPTKRPRTTKTTQGQDAREVTLPNPSDERSSKQNTNCVEQIRMYGRLFRKITLLSRVRYFCYFDEDPDSTVPEPMAFNIEQEYSQDVGNKMSNIQAMDVEGIFTRDVDTRGDTWSWCFKERKTTSPSSVQPGDSVHPAPNITHNSQSSKLRRQKKRIPYSTEEEKLLIDLKKKQNLPWREIAKHFPRRKTSSLQVHYSTKLKDREAGTSKANHDHRDEYYTAKPSLQLTEDNTPRQRYGLRSNRRSPGRFAPE
jgi:hypothetical protein